MKQLATLIISVFIGSYAFGQAGSFKAIKTHSHNDYQQAMPFHQAYQARMNSIEIDVFLHQGQLVAAHEQESIQASKTFRQLYLVPLARYYAENGQKPYPEKDLSLQFLIDIKGDYNAIIPQLIKELSPYDSIFNPKISPNAVQIVLSGNTPPAEQFKDYPLFLKIDGRPNVSYTPEQLARVGMISDDIKTYTVWNGKGTPAVEDVLKMKKVLQKAHNLGKTFRFYGTSDGENTWRQLEQLGVDWINTDHPKTLQDFLQKVKQSQ